MRLQPLTIALTLLTMGGIVAIMPTPSAQAQSSARFFCGRDAQGAPATVVQPAKAGRPPVVLIRWTSKFFNGAGYTPQTRCSIVSKKFQDAYAKNPNFVFTTTIANGEPVICSAQSRGGICDILLYTVKRGYQDPILTMLRLEQTRVGASGALNESSSGNSSVEPAYLGVQDLIAKVSDDDLQATSPQTLQPNPSPVKPFSAPTSPIQVPSGVTPTPLW